MKPESSILPYELSGLPPGPWLVLAPHADDETFGMGGTLLLARAAGIATQLLVMTDGAQGGKSADLVNVRQQEVQVAAGMLGIQGVQFFGEPDRCLQVNDTLVTRLVELIRASNAATVFLPGLYEPHPDHRATALLAWSALNRLDAGQRPRAVAYEISVQNPVNRLVDITEVMAEKRRVMEIYLSQIGVNNYIQLVEAMNKLRTFTLPRRVEYAEGFYHFAPHELATPLVQLLQARIEDMASHQNG